MPPAPDKTKKTHQPSLASLLTPYRLPIAILVILTLATNALNLVVPKLIAGGIDTYVAGSFSWSNFLLEFGLAAGGIFILTYLQSMVQTYASERVARDLRNKLSAKISVQTYSYIEQLTPSKLLTNLTSDVDAVKMFVAQAISSLIASFFLIIGAGTLLLLINWKLALAVLGIVPLLGITFYVVLSRVRTLFKVAQEAIDWLNKVINESILGAALIRLLNAQQYEYQKFVNANTQAKNISLRILNLFAGLIPAITFATNLATLVILCLGGHFLLTGGMTLGDFSAFNNYLAVLIFPILLIGIMTNVIAQATASYQRLSAILNAEDTKDSGTITADLRGDIAVQNVTLSFGEKIALKDVSFEAKAGTKTAIIGPTAAGKTQLMYVLTGLAKPTAGTVLYDDKAIDLYNKEAFYRQIGFVFQDSIVFNLTMRENIAFSTTVTDESLQKAIDTAELSDFIAGLPDKLDTIISERGTSLSGGQKQRIMLARALALNPKILLLDDFTARVDTRTEKKILDNVHKNYPGITLISVTQKITSVEYYDQIVLLMEGEVLATGTHQELLTTSPEYAQIYHSQHSTQQYELHA